MGGEGALRVLIADDVPLFRCGVHTVLSEQLGFEVVGEAADAEEALALVATSRPDVILLDAALPPNGGVELLKRLAAAEVLPPTLVVSARHGADVSVEMLVKALRSVAAGEYWFGRADGSEMVRRVRERTLHAPPARQPDGLTARERGIVAAVASGRTNRDVAAQLGIAEDTVKHHLTDVFDKLGVANRTELAAWAGRQGR